MSTNTLSLITLPTEGDFEGDLSGRLLMLDVQKSPRFSCFGFTATRNSPIHIVPKNAQQEPIRHALKQKILLDVTGAKESNPAGKMFSDIDKAIKSKTMNMTSEDAGLPVITGTDSAGNAYVITPKDEADYARMQEEIRLTGSLRIPKPKPQDKLPSTGLSPIFIEDLPIISGE